MPALFRIPGYPEYVLARAGLYHIVDDRIEPTETLVRLMKGNPITDGLFPALIRCAYLSNSELGGAIKMSAESAGTLDQLEGAGFDSKWGSVGTLFKLLEEATAAVAEERRKQPPFVCGTVGLPENQ